MSRRANDSADSLELLLDTITNAFGGILFLTILMTMQLRLSRPKIEVTAVPEAEQHEIIELESQLAAVIAELELLQKSVSVQDEARARLIDPELEMQFADLRERRRRREQLDQLIRQSRHDASQEQVAIDDLGRRERELDAQRTTAGSQVASAMQALEAERRKRTQTMVPPRTRSSAKLECGMVLRYDRAYLEYQMESGLFDQELNLADFVVIGEEKGHLIVTPKPWAGLPVQKSSEFTARLASKLTAYPADRWYICVMAWEDSFDKFHEFKQGLLDLGYEFRILPAEVGDVFTKNSTEDPQVQ
jgi:hypothetical protein